MKHLTESNNIPTKRRVEEKYEEVFPSRKIRLDLQQVTFGLSNTSVQAQKWVSPANCKDWRPEELFRTYHSYLTLG